MFWRLKYGNFNTKNTLCSSESLQQKSSFVILLQRLKSCFNSFLHYTEKRSASSLRMYYLTLKDFL